MAASGVALIVTVLNEESTLPTLLASIDSQSKAPKEVVICDAGSVDATMAIVHAWSNWVDFPVSVLVRPGVNIAAGRNAAIRECGASIIAVTDGGCVLDREWLANISSPLADQTAEVDIVYGATSARGHSPVGQAFARFYEAKTRGPHMSETERSSRSVAFRKATWEKAGGYPEWLTLAGEDTLFFIRVNAFARQAYRDDAIVHWSHGAETLAAVYAVHRRNSIGSGEANMWPVRYSLMIAGYTTIALGFLGSIRRRRLFFLAAGGLALVCGRHSLKTAKYHGSVRDLLVFPVVGFARDLGMMHGYVQGTARRVQSKLSRGTRATSSRS